MNIAAYTLRKRTIAWLACLVLLIGGYIAYQQLGRFEDPEFVIRQAVIVTPYPGALPSQVAEEVTDAIEGAVQQLQEVKEVTSVSTLGQSRVSVEIDLRFARTKDDLEQVWDKLRRKVADAQRLLPPGAGPSVVNDDFGDVYALFFAVTGDGYRLEQIRDYVEDLARELVLVPGVARVATQGAPQDAIFVEIAAAKAAQLGVSLEQIHQVLRERNLLAAAGDLRVGPQRVAVSPTGQVDSVEAIGNIVLASSGGDRVISLKDVATITRGVLEPPRALVRYDGEPAIGLGVSNLAGGNVVAMGDAVRARLAELESQRPVGMALNVISYQSDAVRTAVDGFVANLVAAVVIVVLVLVLFMGLRSGLIVGAILLLTVAGTLIAMHLDGIAMQRISLGALIIALGMLVDNAIVVTDGILVRLQKGEERTRAAVEVVQATQWPLLGGTAVGILAFSAIGLSPTDMGEYAGSLFWVILYSMLLSWLLAVTLTPLFCVSFLKVKPMEGAGAGSGPVLGRYRRLLQVLLRRRLGTGIGLLALLLAAVLGFGAVPPGFMPESARSQFVVDLYLPQGTDIAVTAAELAEVEAHVRGKPGVNHVTGFVGQGGLRFMLTYVPEDPNSAYGQLLVDVEDAALIAPLIAELQTELEARHPDAAIKVWKFMLGRGGGKKIEAAFRGPDPEVLRALAEQAKAVMANDPDAVAIQDDWREKVPVLRPAVEAIALPPGYALEWEGEYKASREANEGLALSAPYGFAAMVLAVVVMFNAVRQPLVIWLTVPLAIIGVTIGLLLIRVPFEFMAILGFLSLIGMLVKNSIVLVDQADAERRDGKAGLDAVLDAAVSRARPVFLGALTTILGVAPLLLDPFFKSMAVTIMFGLAFATALTLVVVPLLYAVLFRIPDAPAP
ncbi:MAG: efflux RND transporter permease subunit [Thiocapsa sp.]|uniref:efflux RND transporter permease subunit n=1 Tax=Thiocapsa sp. TaxID=2024551 RepID=UPI001BCD57CB|nr:efflux RND transporter permease subunit [Thiocapsa sp.]QVL47223.1 MAG: efflux RND transporter permease subunit [Thiocapsa sp.]